MNEYFVGPKEVLLKTISTMNITIQKELEQVLRETGNEEILAKAKNQWRFAGIHVVEAKGQYNIQQDYYIDNGTKDGHLIMSVIITSMKQKIEIEFKKYPIIL